MLVNGRARSQTSVIMKNLPAKLKLLALTAIGGVVMLIIQACACAPFIDYGVFGLIIERPLQIKNGKEAEFKAALDKLSEGAVYDFHLVPENGSFRDFRKGSRLTIKTDRVITTELAKSLSSNEFTAIGSSLTHHVYSPNDEDILIVVNVLNQIKK